jgi:alkanesulfonate monooxygenase SsuD/methylene tetrahydromethanopterin reductase-like flavin-dependent oxidoreductase (luciferase family)
MEFGVAFTSKIGDYDLVALAESLGFNQAWFFDSQMIYSDVYATMAVAARATKRIRLATGVAVPTTRMAPVIAHSIASIAELAPGRIELGVGNGNTARLTMGLRPVPLPRMKREIRLIQALLRGEAALHECEGESHLVQLLHRKHGFINLDHKIPVTLSAFGDKTLAYCGAECDAHLSWNASPPMLRAARATMGEGARKAGRNVADIPSKVIYPLAVLRPGETAASPRVLKSLGPFITNLLHVMCEWDEKLLPSDAKIANVVQRYRDYEATLPHDRRHLILHEGHLVYTRDDERNFITPEVAEVAAMVGEPDKIIDNIRQLEREGLSHFAFQVTDDPVGQMQMFAETVMRRYYA